MQNFLEHKLFESAPRIPKDINYWKKKGKRGKDVCLIFHDDMDGIVSAILMKNYLDNQGFKVVRYGIINYQEGWDAIRLDDSLINIALDYAEDISQVDVYMDHHGQFEEELRFKQKRPSIKTATGSAAEGIALQIGVPFSKDTKDWIDMIDSAKYDDYEVDIKGILEFDLKEIKKSKNAKLKFAASFNQMLKRSDHKTFIEVVNASKYPSIFNLFRLFKLFYPKNNPDWRSGEEKEFRADAKWRLQTMKQRTKGSDGKKKRYEDQNSFWEDFAKQVREDDKMKWKLNPASFQIIGNAMFVPSGTWANALRAKAIFGEEVEAGRLPDDPKLNFTILQYGNTIQIADILTKIKNMKKEDLPVTQRGVVIDNIGKYTEELVKNFETHLDYSDERTVSGGHWGIGTVSNIFGTCKKAPYKGVKFLDIFKNKIISDISGVQFRLNMPWNELEGKFTVKEDDINAKVMEIDDVRTEKQALREKKEKKFLSYIIYNDLLDSVKGNFENSTIKKLFKAFKTASYQEISNLGTLDFSDIKRIKFFNLEEDKGRSQLADTYIFGYLLENFDFDELYEKKNSAKRKAQRKELKRMLYMILNIIQGEYVNNSDKEKLKEEFQKWNK